MSKRILVVEDQEDSRRILRDLLKSADYEIMEAVNGEEALTAAATQRPDLILMDIQLPIMDGYEATRRIKADPTLTHVPVIAVTSYALSGDFSDQVRDGREPQDRQGARPYCAAVNATARRRGDRMIRRRDFITSLGAAAAWPVVARAQQATMPVIGYLGNQSADNSKSVTDPFLQGLKET